MHTVIVVSGGLALLAACLLLGQAWGGTNGLATGAKLFIPLWLIGAAVNMAVGVSIAGYTVAEEFPIFLGVFAGPALVAVAAWWKFG
ncbi:MAG TPA: hypothetical protein VIP10_02285 [Burkholderiaceae bacterium]